MSRRRKRTLGSVVQPYLRTASIVAGVLLLVIALGIGATVLLVDPNSFKPEIAAAVKRATGRDLVMLGPIKLAFGLPPTLVLDNVVLANVPGGSRPEMLMLDRLELRAALLPLLSREFDILQLTLVRPDLLLETDAAGHGNWNFARPADAVVGQAAANDAGPAAGRRTDYGHGRFAVRSVRVRDLHVRWRNGRTASTAEWTVPRLDAEAEEAGRSMLLTGNLISGGRSLTVRGELGAVGRLLDPKAALPWPIDVVAQADGFRLALRGTLTSLAGHGFGYTLHLDAAVTDLTAVASLLPQPLPQLRDATLSARLTDGDGQGLVLSGITLHATDLVVPSLTHVAISRFDLSAPSLDQPVTADAELVANDTSIHLLASVGALSALMPGAAQTRAVPVEMSAEAAGGLITFKGSVRSLVTLSGLDGVVLARVPSVMALGKLLQRDLPDWRQLALDATVDGQALAGGTLGLHRIALSLPQADLGGDLAVVLGPRPTVRGKLSAKQIDLDGLLASLAGTTRSRTAPPPGRPPSPTSPKPAWLISGEPLDLTPLDRADADLQFVVAALQTNGVSYSNIAGHVVLQNGRLTLDPFAVDTPGGRLDAKLSVDSRAPSPAVALSLHTPAVSLQALAAAFGEPDVVTGTASVDADLRGVGQSPHALAAALDGRLGIAVSDGDVDNALLTRALGAVLKVARLPPGAVGGVGRTKLRCFAARTDFAHGEATVGTLVADTTRLIVEGGGSADLGRETLALKLRPMLRTGPGIVVPVQVGGTFLDPKITLDPTLGGKGGVLLGIIAGALPTDRSGDPCPAALAAVRGTAPVPPVVSAPSAPAPSAPAPAKPLKPIDVLRGLLR